MTPGAGHLDSTGRAAAQLERFALALALLLALMSIAVLIGWWLGVAVLKSFVPSLAPMPAAAALAFLLAAISLALFHFGTRRAWATSIAELLAAFVIVASMLSLIGHLTGSSMGLDQLLSGGSAAHMGPDGAEFMTPSTSFGLLLLGVALLLGGPGKARDPRPAQLLAMMVVMLSAVAWIEYATGSGPLGVITSYTEMTAQTVVAFTVAALSFLCSQPRKGLMAFLISDSAGAIAARRLLPAAIGLPIVLVWLMTLGENAELYSESVGTWLYVLVSVIGLVALVWLTVRPLDRSDRELKALAADLERSNHELENFAYIASHDLKQPLSMISGYIQLLAKRYRGSLGTEADEFIGHAVGGAERLKRMIDDLLAYSRAGRSDRPLEPVDVNSVFDKAMLDLKISLEETKAQVEHGPLPLVMADPTQLEEVFQNLIGNAIKFNDSDRPHVHIAAQSTNGKWVFKVEDNGIGVNPGYSDHIFEIFHRHKGSERYSGSGLGLAICKKIVERHGGDIWLESQPGRGSAFFFTMPTAEEGGHGRNGK